MIRRRLISFLFRPAPRGWARESIWIGIGVGLAVLAGFSSHWDFHGGTNSTYCSQWPDGTWHLIRNRGSDVQRIELSGHQNHEKGTGWERWTVSYTLKVAPLVSPAPAPPTGEVLESLKAQMVLMVLGDAWPTAATGEGSPWRARLLRDGKAELLAGPLGGVAYYLPTILIIMAILLVAAGMIIGNLRSYMRARLRNRLDRAAAGCCPICNYDLRGRRAAPAAPLRCTECGTKPAVVVEHARWMLRERRPRHPRRGSTS